MHWYGGSIAEAVTLSKQKNAIFVVFVEGENDLSVEMSQTIDDTAVVSRLSNQEDFLAVKLKSGTTNYTHFAQIYQFVPVPSLFFIGRNGTPLEVVCAGVQPSNLATRIDRILAEHHNPSSVDLEKPPSVQPSTSSQNIKEQTVNLLQSEAAVSPPHGKLKDEKAPAETEHAPPPSKVAKPDDDEVVCVGDVCVRRPKQPDQPSTSHADQTPTSTAVSAPAPTAASASHAAASAAPAAASPAPAAVTDAPAAVTAAPSVAATTSTAGIEEKVDHAKELIEARRREKAAQEKELEIQRELERRMTGQGVAELKRWQADQEMRQIQDERKREKLENDLARQRILEQIAQDRAERRARDNPAPAPSAAPVAPQQTSTPTPHPTSGDGSSGAGARIQFKLPDGTSHTAHFAATGTLAQVQSYVADNLQLSSSNFALWTAFPRRELTEAGATLRDLQLAPSAALLVLPRRHAAPAPQASPLSVLSFITQILTSLIYDPTVALYTWIRARLFPPPPAAPRAASPTPRPPAAPGAPQLRRRGNIHRLPGDAPDDDNNTWNGNSTQQM